MELQERIEIDRPIDAVWQLLANRFGEVSEWRHDVQRSRVSGKGKLLNASFSSRILEINGKEHEEVLTSLDPDQRSLSYRRSNGLPFYVRKVSTIWSLTRSVNGNTLVVVNQTVAPRPVFSVLVLFGRRGFRRKMRLQLTDLKHALEHSVSNNHD